jgi:hypothetical protein
MITRSVLFFLLIALWLSCKSQTKWDGGAITKEGVYVNEEFKIIVILEEYSVDYFLLDSSGDTLVRSDRKFSTVHKWALQLDKDQTLWVFSSDIGHGCWQRDPTNKKYFKREFVGSMPIDLMPAEVYNTLKKFHPYSNKK